MLKTRIHHQYSKSRAQVFECTMCPRKFFLESYYILHVRSHLREKHLLCHTCGKRFSKIYYFQMHLRRHNLPEIQQDSSERRLQDASENLLQEPEQDSSEKHVQCFLNAVQKSCSSSPKKFGCTMCPRRFFLESYYILHVRSHVRDYNLLCHVCGKRFSKIYYFQRHLLVHNLEKLQKDCSKRPPQDTPENPPIQSKNDSSEKRVQCPSNAGQKACLSPCPNKKEIPQVILSPETSLVPVQMLLKRFVSIPSNIPMKNLVVCDRVPSQPSAQKTGGPVFSRFNNCQNSSVPNIKPPEKRTDGFSCNCCKMSFYYEVNLKKHVCPPLKRNIPLPSAVPLNLRNFKPPALPKDLPKMPDSTPNDAAVKDPAVSVGKGKVVSISDKHPHGARLLRHKNGRTRFSCNSCKKLYYSKDHFDEHVCEAPDKETFNCHLCSKVFDRLGPFNKHLHTHTKPFVCKICGKNFGRRMGLIYHSRVHTGEKPYECDICKKTFSQKPHLISHSLVHTGAKPYECTVCGKKFAKKSIVAVHFRVHTGERPYSCILCQRTFSNYSSLSRHKRSHTGEKPYSCEICQKTFTERKVLHRHLKQHETK